MTADLLATLGIVFGSFAMLAAVAIRFRSIRATMVSMRALRSHDVKSIVLRVADKDYRVSLLDDTGGEDIREVRRAVERARARVLDAA